MAPHHKGLSYALAAYFFWGVVPIFWKQLSQVDSFEIIAYRMIGSCLIALGVIVLSGQWQSFKSLYRQPKVLLRSAIAGSLIVSNWFVFIWAVTNEHIVQMSMGYFINPLISVMIGVVLFGDPLRRGQIIPLSIILIAVVYQVYALGEVPLIALFLAFTFASYAGVKKTIKLPAVQGMGLEMTFFVLPALLYLLFLAGQGKASFGESIELSMLLSLAGFFTIMPLLLFAAAAKRATMTVLGMTQYIAPSLQLMIGVIVYKESFGQTQLITFGLIWFALLLYSIDQIKHARLTRI